MTMLRSGTLALAFSVALAGCGGGESGPAAAPAAPVAKVALADLPAPWNAADLDNGKLVFAKCHNCHTLGATDGHKTGPNLHGVFTRHPGTAPGYKYSEAMRGNSHTEWTPVELDKWLTNPSTYLPGTAMFFNGVADETDRRDVIAYVAVQSTQ